MVAGAGVARATIITIALLCFQRATFVWPLSIEPSSNHSTFWSLAASPRRLLAASVDPRFDWQQVASGVDSYVKSVLNRLGSSDVGPRREETEDEDEELKVPNILHQFPTAQDLNLSFSLAGAGRVRHPELLLTSPSYGNWSDHGWQLRLRGSLYKQPNISNRTIRRLARIFGLGSFVSSLRPAAHAHLVNMVRGLFILPQRNVELSFQLKPACADQLQDVESQNFRFPALERGDGRTFDAPYPTNLLGDYDFFYPISDICGEQVCAPGDGMREVQVINVQGNRPETGHTLSYLVPPSGHTIVSDIDDVLRVSTICQLREGLQNLLTRPFYPWMNMPEIFAIWAAHIPGVHFHYLTTSPKQMGQSYMDYVFEYYPAGSFDARIINVSDIPSSLSIRRFLLEKVIQTFPERTFTLVGDSSNFDIMADFPKVAKKYPDRVQCLLVRNTSATDPGHWVPYNTKGFRDLDPESYMFFRVPDDLVDLDIANGQCYNSSVPQNLTFGWQGFFPFSP